MFIFVSLQINSQEVVNELYGFSIGDSKEKVNNKFGKPDRVGESDESTKYELFFLKKKPLFYVIFYFSSLDYNLISSIQITGTDTNVEIGYKNLKLGIPNSRLVNLIGEPNNKKDIGKYGEQWYYNNTNFSLEVNNEGNFSSFKISDTQKNKKIVDSFIPKDVQSVFNYILHSEYLELFGDSSQAYRFRPLDWEVIDIDNDGLREVFLLINPYFALTAPIQIYQIQNNDKVLRIRESLAPGEPVEITDDCLDSHVGGYGVDYTISDSVKTSYRREFISAGFNSNLTSIEFSTFIHSDTRIDNGGGFIDLSKSNFKNVKNNCEGIKLARPTEISSGELKNKTGKFIIVNVNKELWLYKINRIINNSFFEKEIRKIDLPKNFVSFTKDEKYLSYLDGDQNIHLIEID